MLPSHLNLVHFHRATFKLVTYKFGTQNCLQSKFRRKIEFLEIHTKQYSLHNFLFNKNQNWTDKICVGLREKNESSFGSYVVSNAKYAHEYEICLNKIAFYVFFWFDDCAKPCEAESVHLHLKPIFPFDLILRCSSFKSLASLLDKNRFRRRALTYCLSVMNRFEVFSTLSVH